MEKYNELLKKNREWAETIFSKIDKKTAKMTLRSRNKLPDGVDENGIHKNMYPQNKAGWTNGFWGATNLILYNHTENEEYLKTARCSEKLLNEVLEDYEMLHHDVGFMWHILAGSDYKITGNLQARNTNLFMASVLFSRFVLTENGGFIRAWNGKKDSENANYNWSIVDTLMNLPLLYWASQELDDDRFARIATAHADMALRDHIRPDGSVNHIVEHDRKTGKSVKTYGGQGYGEGSSWSRGCAWALYGFVLSYLYTKEERYLEGAKKVADHFIKSCEGDWLPRIDFYAPETPVYYDSTAGAIAASGLIELAKVASEECGYRYADAAVKILRAMTEKFCDFDSDNDHLLGCGSVRYPVDGNLEKNGVHISIIYGDYFYTEAILKLLGEEYLPW